MTCEFLWNDPLSSLSYALLMAAILSLWFCHRLKVWGTLAGSSLLIGLIARRIAPLGILSILALAGSFYFAQAKTLSGKYRLISGGMGILISIALAAHILPGFNNWKVADESMPFATPSEGEGVKCADCTV